MRSNRDAEFTEFAQASQQRMFRQAFLLCGNREQAQDLVQHTLTQVYVRWARIDNPGGYAHRILTREFLDQRRRASRERELLEPDDPLTRGPDTDGALTVLQALAQLPPRMRAVVVLRHWEDLSVTEVALALGCSTGTVKSTTSKALDRLRDLLGDTFRMEISR